MNHVRGLALIRAIPAWEADGFLSGSLTQGHMRLWRRQH
jgi:hypothetical protein